MPLLFRILTPLLVGAALAVAPAAQAQPFTLGTLPDLLTAGASQVLSRYGSGYSVVRAGPCINGATVVPLTSAMLNQLGLPAGKPFEHSSNSLFHRTTLPPG